MFNFNLKKTAIYRSLVMEDIPPFLFSGFFRDFFAALSLVSFLLFLLKDSFTFAYAFEVGVGSLALFFFFFEINLFFKKYLSSPKLLVKIENFKEEMNMAEFLDLPSARLTKKTLSMGGADSYLLLYYLLKSGEVDFILSRSLINKREVLRDLNTIFKERKKIRDKSFSLCFEKTMKEALSIAKEKGRITPGDIFASLCKHNEYMREVLYRVDMKAEDVLGLVSWKEHITIKKESFSYKEMIKKGSLGKQWSSGYTVLLDEHSIDLSEKMRLSGFPKTIGHEKELAALERVLSKKEINSAVLVGEPGTGRKSIIYELARRSFLGESLPEINYMRIVQLDIPSILSRSDGVEETETILDNVFKEAVYAGNVIIVIDEMHNFVGGEKRPGAVNISGVLEPYLHYVDFRLIGVTSFVGFRREVEENPSLLSLLEKVEVSEVSEKETLLLLERMVPYLEKNYHKFISYSAMQKIIQLTSRYMSNNPFPEKAMSLLEEAVVHIDQKKEYILFPHHIADIVSEKVEVPVGAIEEDEKNVLLNLEDLMHERIVNQEMAVKEVSSALRRSRAGVSIRKGLMGSFLFLGPTGVGKTETAKAIADIYFKSQKKMIRIDMSEFQSISDISRLIGSSTEEGILTHRIREEPFCLVLLDEIEKAHPDVLNIFLQVLDEGHVTDGVGRKVDFRSSMVIATSNAGYQVIIDAVEKKENWKELKKKILGKLFRQSIFRPEFVNRFDAVVLFEPLSKENLVSISGMLLEKVAKDLKEKDMELIITEDLKRSIVEMSYDPLFGAREMQRIIQDKVGNILSSAILKEEIKKGDRFTIDAERFIIIKNY